MEFRVLGPLEVLGDSGPIHLGGQKQRAVLAHLLVRANRVVSTDELSDALWPDGTPSEPRASIHTYVSNLRRALDGARIENRPPGYQLTLAPGQLDSLRFENMVGQARKLGIADQARALGALDEALGLWRGAAYGDLGDDPRLRAEGARLEHLRLAALEERNDILLAAGRERDVIEAVEPLTHEQPTRERLWRQLMLALYRSGRRGDALETYLEARRAIVEALGVEPSPELGRLHMSMLKHDPALDVIGRPLRGYVLLEQIGQGAFGTVHRAAQPEVGRDVAIKVIHDRFAGDADFIRRFEREAQLVARLEHPHVVPLYDYWRDPSGAYLVMRYMRGGNLESSLKSRGPLAGEQAMRIVDDLASALMFAHRQGIVHRDVRPSNVLFDEEGRAYLSDFGVAKQFSVTATGNTPSPGIAHYLSPEELLGEPVTAAADVYSLGLLIFEMLAGRHPYADSPPSEVRARHIAGDIPALTLIRTDVAASVDLVLRRACASAPGDRFPDAVSLAAALRGALIAKPATEDAVVTDVRNPYKGLRAFLEPDAADYFGRDSLVRRSVERLAGSTAGSRFLAVVGPSGSGKSSLVHAGVIPALRAGAVAGSEGWFYVTMHPGTDPFAELASALTGIAGDEPVGLLQVLQEEEDGIRKAAEMVLPVGRAELVLLIDQFEELFTLVVDEDVRARFLKRLSAAVTDHSARLRVIVTLRADFYDRPLLYSAFGDLLAERTQAVTPLSITELEEVIAEPARAVGLEVEPALMAEIVAEVGGQPALPLLQYTLTELLERRQGGLLTAQAFRQLGGVSAAVGRGAEAIYSGLDVKQKEATRQIFLRLVTLGEEGRAETRRRALRSELTGLELEQGAVDVVLDRFGAHRLLTFDRDPVTRGPTVEVAHEALIREWGRLRGWLDSAHEDLRAHRRLATAAREWELAGREASFLLTGARLAQIESSSATSSLSVTADERGYLEASIARRASESANEQARKSREVALERRSRSRLRALVAIFAMAAIVASALSIFAFNQQSNAVRQARVATARELTAAAQANLEVDPERSMLLALRAIDTVRGVDSAALSQAESILHRALKVSRVERTIANAGTLVSWGHLGDYIALARQSDGRVDLRSATTGELIRSWQTGTKSTFAVKTLSNGLLATSAGDGAIRVWDPSSGKLVRALIDSPGDVWGLSTDARSTLVAGLWWDSVSQRSLADVFDVQAGRKVMTIRKLESSDVHDAARSTSLSPDGRLIGIARAVPTVDIYSVATGKLIRQLNAGSVFRINAMAWSPDGTRIATVGQDFFRVWDVMSGTLLATLVGHTSAIVDVDWSSGGSRIVTASDDGTLRVWDANVHSGLGPLLLAGHDVGVVGVSMDDAGDRLVSVGFDGTAKIWNVGLSGDAEWMNFVTDPGWYSDVIFTPDGANLVGSDLNGRVKIWNSMTGEVVRTLEGHGRAIGLGLDATASVATIAVSPDGKLIATGGRDALVKVWRASDGLLLQTFHDDGWVEDVKFSSDGKFLATGAQDHTARLINLATGNEALVLTHSLAVLTVAFGPGDRTLITAAGGDVKPLDPTPIRIWDIPGGSLNRDVADSGFLRQMAVNRARTMIAATFEDGTVRVWELSTGRLISRMSGPSASMFAISFSPDGRFLATGSDDGDVRIWDVMTGTNTLSLPGHGGPVGQVAFSPDGKRLASSGGDGKIRVWALDLDDLISITKHRLTRSLTAAECQQYLHQASC